MKVNVVLATVTFCDKLLKYSKDVILEFRRLDIITKAPCFNQLPCIVIIPGMYVGSEACPMISIERSMVEPSDKDLDSSLPGMLDQIEVECGRLFHRAIKCGTEVL